jgi:hypothetical protein
MWIKVVDKPVDKYIKVEKHVAIPTCGILVGNLKIHA